MAYLELLKYNFVANIFQVKFYRQINQSQSGTDSEACPWWKIMLCCDEIENDGQLNLMLMKLTDCNDECEHVWCKEANEETSGGEQGASYRNRSTTIFINKRRWNWTFRAMKSNIYSLVSPKFWLMYTIHFNDNTSKLTILPEHNVMPDISDNIQYVYPFPSLNSFKNSTYIMPNVYVIPSAIINRKRWNEWERFEWVSEGVGTIESMFKIEISNVKPCYL